MMAVPDGDRPAICTIVTASYRVRGRCLLESFREHHPHALAFVLEVDGPAPAGAWADLRVAALGVEALQVPDLPALRARYDTFELCNALKPFLLAEVFRRASARKVCYLDADVCVFDQMQAEVWDELDACDILLTPHLCRVPAADDPDLVWRDLAVLQHGVYNGGFVGLARSLDADRFLEWWGSRVLRAGHKRLAEGMNCDQRWLDLLPGFGLSLKVSGHPGLNAAYWNLHERRFELREGRHFVNGLPLKFFHFSGYGPDRPEQLTSRWTSFTFQSRPDVRPVFEAYHRRLLAAGALSQEPPEVASAGAAADKDHPRPSESVGPATPAPRMLDADAAEMPAVFGGGHPGEAHASLAIPEAGPSRPKPRVSVVMPAYNAGRYLAEAIESVLAQTGEPYELIVVDDGSTDDTAAVLAGYGERIRRARQEHEGVSVARNRGVEMARGELVAFLDADDRFVLPTKLAEQAARFEADPGLDIVHSGWRMIEADGTPGPVREPWRWAPALDLRAWLLHHPVLPSAMMVRRATLERAGGFDPTLSVLEDVDLMLRLALAGAKAAWLEKVTVEYRRHGGGASGAVHRQGTALARITRAVFARPDLPAEVRALEREFRYQTLVWMAYRFHAAGCMDEAVDHLRASLPHAPASRAVAPLGWIDRFEALYAADGARWSVFELTTLPQWRRLLGQVGLGARAEPGDLPRSRHAASLPDRPSQVWAATVTPSPVADAPAAAKLDLRHALGRDYGRHRSGWAFALQSLAPLHRPGGIAVDAFVEHTFDQDAPKPGRPWREPWIGFVHNPPGAPSWFVPTQSPQRLLESPAFRESLPSCLGLFCLSAYHRRWLSERLDVPLAQLLPPTAVPTREFSVARFIENPVKRLVQVGSWLRRLHSIHHVPVTRLRRTMVHQHLGYIRQLLATEQREWRLAPDWSSVEVLPFLPEAEYDALLAENVVYLDLYDASANNTIVECIARATPVVVNPLPAVREYLGEDYPLYFVSREQAARRAEDLACLEAAHDYLRALPIRSRLTDAAFLASVSSSAIYAALPPGPA